MCQAYIYRVTKVKIRYLRNMSESFNNPLGRTSTELHLLKLNDNKSLESNLKIPIWEQIVQENQLKLKEISEYRKSKLPPECTKPDCPEIFFLQNVIELLEKILEKTIFKAEEYNILIHQKTRFNAIDFISECLWNMNPLYPERKENWLNIFDIPWVKSYLKENPRPYFPMSWLWSKEKAAIIIQAAMRGYWVRRKEEVQEMRLFWKALYQEKLEKERHSLLKSVFGE